MKDQPENVTPAPEPVQPPVAPAPVQQWQQTPPAQAQVQYVVAQKSLDGIGGWLAFWLVVFSIGSVGQIMTFFNLLGTGVSTPAETLSVIFAPILAAGYLSSVILIALRKKYGIWTSMATIGVATIFSIISMIISGGSGNYGTMMGTLVGYIIFGGLMALYFYASKRVKATLRN